MMSDTPEQLLAKLNAQYEFIAVTLREIKDNLSFADGRSSLRDSVKVLVNDSMVKQYKSCGEDMRSVAELAASEATIEHVREFHNKKSVPPVPRTSFWAGVSDKNKNRMIGTFVAAISVAGTFLATKYGIGI